MPTTKVYLRLTVDIDHKDEKEFWELLECSKKQIFSSNPYIKVRDTITHDIPKLPAKD